MAFISIPQSWIGAGKFAIQSLMQRIKDNFDALYGSLNTQSTGKVLNPSFEVDSDSDGAPDNWDISLYPGGSQSLDTTSPTHGAQALKFTHPGGTGNGGGYATGDYIEVTALRTYVLALSRWCSAAGMKVIIRIKQYDKDKLFISNLDLATSTSNPTSATRYYYSFNPTSTCRHVKVELHGGVSDTDVAGNAFFDDLTLDEIISGNLVASSAISEGKIASSAVSQTKLKTALHELSAAAGVVTDENMTSPVGSYGFWPQGKISSGFIGSDPVMTLVHTYMNTTYKTYVRLDNSGGTSGTTYAHFRYVTSSGEIYWLWIIRDKLTRRVLSMSVAPDYFCLDAGEGDVMVEQPFGNYDPDKHEVILVTAERQEDGFYSGAFGEAIRTSQDNPAVGLLEIVENNFEVDEASEPTWPSREITVAVRNAEWLDPRPATPIKRRVQKPNDITHRVLRRKAI